MKLVSKFGEDEKKVEALRVATSSQAGAQIGEREPLNDPRKILIILRWQQLVAALT